MSGIKAILISTLFLLLADKTLANGDYEVVIHPETTQKTVSKNVLRAIFSMRLKTWPDGELIKVFVLPDDHALHQKFSKERLSVFPYQLRATWDRLAFSGTGQAPTRVSSNEEMLEKIATTPGAIGYLESELINNDVHVLQIH